MIKRYLMMALIKTRIAKFSSIALLFMFICVLIFIGCRTNKGNSGTITHKSENTKKSSSKSFTDLGVTSPYANDRGIIASKNSEGKNAAYLWLFDHRGSFGLLSIETSTGQTKQFPMPFNVGGDAVYASLYSTQKKLYTQFNGNFVEFDPQKDAFTFQSATTPGAAMGLTEDDRGRIWAVTYPNSGLVCFDPHTKQLTDYGIVHKENWNQYQRYVATDDKGWVYFAIGNTLSQIVAFNPENRKATPLLSESERKQGGSAYVYRDKDGKVYGQALSSVENDWYEIYQGSIRKIGVEHAKKPVEYITGSQSLRYLNFPDGQRIEKIDLIEREMMVKNGSEEEQKITFDYQTEGTHTMNVIAAPDKKHIVGGSAFPMRMFVYDTESDTWERTKAYAQNNALAIMGDNVLFATYPTGWLIAWDTKKPFKDAGSGASEDGNPRLLYKTDPVINRPARVIALSDKKTVVMGGTPAYGYTGGGLLFYDLSNGNHVLLKDNEVVADQSTFSMVELESEKILSGTTTAPGTGGEKKASQAVLYIIDKNNQQIEWEEAVIPGVQTYDDLVMGDDGLVYGFADSRVFFVFDPQTRRIVYQKSIPSEYGNAVRGHSHQIFVKTDKGDVYVLFSKAILKVDKKSFELELEANTPQTVTAGGAFLNGAIYYISGSHLFRYQL